jgi:hypothetical protein
MALIGRPGTMQNFHAFNVGPTMILGLEDSKDITFCDPAPLAPLIRADEDGNISLKGGRAANHRWPYAL